MKQVCEGAVYVKDGEDVTVIARLEPSVFDPNQSYDVAQTYRVVANSFGPTLELMPLKKNTTIIEHI